MIVKVELPLYVIKYRAMETYCLIKHHTMQMYGGLKV